MRRSACPIRSSSSRKVSSSEESRPVIARRVVSRNSQDRCARRIGELAGSGNSQDRGTRRIEELAGSRNSQDRGTRGIGELAEGAPTASRAILRALRYCEPCDTASVAVLRALRYCERSLPYWRSSAPSSSRRVAVSRSENSSTSDDVRVRSPARNVSRMPTLRFPP
jgi:hypothetical protein